MKGTLRKQGQYELFETTKSHQILTLNQQDWYAIVEGNQGEIIVLSDSDHEKKETIQTGQFYLADFQNDPEFNDVPHLFLEGQDHYQEFILPNGLPTTKDYQKKLVRSKENLSVAKIEEYLEK